MKLPDMLALFAGCYAKEEAVSKKFDQAKIFIDAHDIIVQSKPNIWAHQNVVLTNRYSNI
jgi:hypothetical protein